MKPKKVLTKWTEIIYDSTVGWSDLYTNLAAKLRSVSI
jgi:hypothetical protein